MTAIYDYIQLLYYNFMKEHSTLDDMPPAQKMGKVPFKNWVDIVSTARTAPEVKLEHYAVSVKTRRQRGTTRTINIGRRKQPRTSRRRKRITPPMPSISQMRWK